MHKFVVILVLAGSLFAAPVLAVTPGQEVKDAKRLTPVLDLLADGLERVGIKLFDNAVYSMERLWQDTVSLRIKSKTKI